MAEFITQIPGYGIGVQRISATDEVSASFMVAQMAAVLSQKWNTNVLCVSLDGQKGAIESLIPQDHSFGRIHVLDQKNPEFEVVRRKAEGFINRRFVRALIISGAERLSARFYKDRPEKGRAWINLSLEGLAGGMRIPIILVSLSEEGTDRESPKSQG